MEIKDFLKKYASSLIILFFIGLLFYIQIWMVSYADYPYQDEYHSILQALGKGTYPNNLHVRFLSLFTLISRNFYDVFYMNFILSGFCLCLLFFLYHRKRNISLATNIFVTSTLALCSLHITLSRKMHFWAIAFYFLILLMADRFEGRARGIFLFLSLGVLGFFRMEFAFAAALALSLSLGIPKTKKQKIISFFIFSLGGIAAAFLIYQYVGGMKPLLSISLATDTHPQSYGPLERLWNLISIFVFNIFQYGKYVVYTLWRVLLDSYFTMMNAFLLLLFIQKSFKEKGQNYWREVRDNQLFYYVAMVPLLAVRNLDSYIIMFYVLMLSLLAFMLDTRGHRWISKAIIGLCLMAFLFDRPNYADGVSVNFPSIRAYNGLINKPMHDLIQSLPKVDYENRFRILSYERIGEVLGHEGLEFYLYFQLKDACSNGEIPFDIVLIQDSWEYDPNIKIIKKCVLPALASMKRYTFAPGYDLFLSQRLQNIAPRTFGN
nr:hypothetical protein BHI3_04460 [Bacteriovorax sp. HI3]